jgi:hypothetical protein
MFRTTATQEKAPDLNGMVNCAHCGSAMNRVADNYSCPNSAAGTGQRCSTPPVNADRLLRRVMSKLVARILTEETLQLVSENIQETTEANAHLQRERLETAESAIAKMNRRRTSVLHPVEQRTAAYADVAGEINEIEKATTGLAYESLVARNELEKLDRIRDEAEIRSAVTNLDTYLGSVNAGEAQELLDMTIREVRVSGNAAMVVYTEPILSEEHPEGTSADMISLN